MSEESEVRDFLVEASFAVDPEALGGRFMALEGGMPFMTAEDGGVTVVVSVKALGPIHASLLAATGIYDLLGSVYGAECVTLTPYATKIIDTALWAEFWGHERVSA